MTEREAAVSDTRSQADIAIQRVLDNQKVFFSRDDVINLMISEGYLKSDKLEGVYKPNHGSCCTCQHWSYPHDECVCGHNGLLGLILNLKTYSNKSSQLLSDIKFLLHLVPEWVKRVPKGLDPTFYGT